MIQKDKILHFLGGMAIYCFFLVAFDMRSYEGIVIAFAIGCIKELYDYRRTGFNFFDLLATVAGSVFMYLIFLIILYYGIK